MKKRQAGFSLVEVMMVIGVTVFLSLLAISYNRSTDIQILLFRDQSTVVSILNRAKSLAIEKFYEPGSIACAFGVHFNTDAADPKKFILFQDFPSNGCETADSEYTGSGEDFEVYSLDRRLSFTLAYGASPTTVTNLDILFIPPHLEVASTQNFPITLTIQAATGEAVGINISASGQITTTD